jgi:heterodisulfide reductase subunit A
MGLRLGVYICHCGGNISDTVDVKRVRDAVERFENVIVAETEEYVCSTVGQESIKRGVKEHGLNRIVVAACTPRMHLETFKRAVSEAGLNPYLLEMVNIREQDSWVHDEVDVATAKAIDLIRGAVNRARCLEELWPIKVDVRKSVLIIGGGIAGIQAALDTADQGYQVYLIDRSPSLGGHMAQLSKTFPTLDCALCILAPKLVSVSQHPNIKVITMAEPIAVSGSPGDYNVKIKVRPRYVTDECTSCGDCVKVCPVVAPNEFDAGLMPKRAIYLPFAQAVPFTYTIDRDLCVRSDTFACDICFQACGPRCIDFDMKSETFELEVGSMIIATGFEQIDPEIIGEYRFGSHPDIVTNLQFERLMVNGLRKPSNGERPRKVAFVLCVGSRILTVSTGRGVEHCCKIGCMVAIKQSLLFLKEVSNAEPWIFYQDIRADGKGYEEFYANARDHNVRFVRGLVAEIVPCSDGVVVKAEDTVLGMQIEEKFDLVVLNTAIVPSSGTEGFSKILGLHIGSDGFLLERHFKLRPVDSVREGIYLCGCALGPKDIRETVLESMSAASKVTSFIGKGVYLASPETARVLPEKCDLCGECIPACPVGAITSVDSGMKFDPILCTGCGVCISSCPNEAIDLNHCTEEQLINQIRGVGEGGTQLKIIAFLEKNTAYAAADYAGQMRSSYPHNVRVIAVPSTGRIGLKHLLHAFASGADGIVLIEGDESSFTLGMLKKHVRRLGKDLRANDIEPLRLVSTTTTISQYNKILKLFETFSMRVSRLGRVSPEVRKRIEEKLK